MTGEEPITAWRSRALDRLASANATGHHDEAEVIAEELRTAHIALGQRRIGTVEEQRTYLLARNTRTPLPDLLAAGLDTNDWPPPPNSPTPVSPQATSPATEERISSMFRSTGALEDPSPPRYVSRYRPEDGQRYRDHLLPWAIWDTHLNIAVGWHGDQDLTDYQAGKISDTYAARGRQT
ncbi:MULTISPECIES: hypothetical protein [unclassified Streptomyces]|uniref:hypothetical protein n=1 Tax=unclassified Streptomyces TaxID=2593676 RepID=UPI0035DFA478